jgi:hypothetical protein
MIIKFDKFLNESPDRCYYYYDNNDYDILSYTKDDAIAFAYHNGRMGFSKFGDWHSRIFDISRDNLINPGRLWKNHKIISFWSVSELSSLYQTIIDINKHALSLKDTMPDYYFQIDETWKIEILNKNTKNSEIFNIFDFIKLAPKGYNSKYTVNWDDEYRDIKHDEVIIDVKDYLPSYNINDKPLKNKLKYDY